MVIEPLRNANAAAKCLLKNPQRVKKSTEKVGPFEALVNLRLRRWDTSSGASVLLRYVVFTSLFISIVLNFVSISHIRHGKKQLDFVLLNNSRLFSVNQNVSVNYY